MRQYSTAWKNSREEYRKNGNDKDVVEFVSSERTQQRHSWIIDESMVPSFCYPEHNAREAHERHGTVTVLSSRVAPKVNTNEGCDKEACSELKLYRHR